MSTLPPLAPGSPNYRGEPMTSKLLKVKEIDEADDLDKNWAESFKALNDSIKGLSERDAAFRLQDQANDMTMHASITMGILYAIITEPDRASMFFKFLTIVVRDNYLFAVGQLKTLTRDKYPKLLDQCYQQTLWLVRELVLLNVQESDVLCMILFRQAASGDLSQRNITLIQSLVRLCEENREFIYSHQALLCTAVFTFLRFIPDHTKPFLQSLRQQEVDFCKIAIRERFNDLTTIGRDFVRLLFEAKSASEIEYIWNDLLQNPADLGGQQFAEAGGVNWILNQPTQKIYLQSRLTFEMEKYMLFMMKEVRMGNQRRYQGWFAQKFLSTPESESLIADLIRFTCAVFHPSNHILSLNFVPRWAMIGWLLKTVKTPSEMNRCKTSLFFDWVYFSTDSVMNLEPAILLLMYSIPKYADITQLLLTFLLDHTNFAYDLKTTPTSFIQNLHRSFSCVVEKGVVASLCLLADCPQLDSTTRDKLKRYFPTLCKPPPTTPQSQPPPPQQSPAPTLQQPQQQQPRPSSTSSPLSTTAISTSAAHDLPPLASSSPNRDEKMIQAPSPVEPQRKQETEASSKRNVVAPATPSTSSSASSSTAASEQPDSSFQTLNRIPTSLSVFEPHLSRFIKAGNDLNMNKNELEKILSLVASMETLSISILEELGLLIPRVLSAEFGQVFLANKEKTSRSMTRKLLIAPTKGGESVSSNNSSETVLEVLFDVLMSKIKKASKGDRVYKRFQILMKKAAMQETSLGYRALLYSIKKENLMSDAELEMSLVFTSPCEAISYVSGKDVPVSLEEPTVSTKKNPDKAKFYRWLMDARGGTATTGEGKEREERDIFARDIRACGEDSNVILSTILPALYRHVPDLSVGNVSFLRSIAATVLPSQLQDCQLLASCGRIKFLGESMNLVSAFETAMSWDTFEQASFWELVYNEIIFRDSFDFLSVMKQLFQSRTFNPKQNPDFLLKLMNLAKVYEPTDEILKFVLASLSPMQYGRFPSSLVANWLHIHRDVTVKGLSKILKEMVVNSASASTTTHPPKVQFLLGHLVQLKHAENILEPEGVTSIFKLSKVKEQLNKLKTSSPTLSNLANQFNFLLTDQKKEDEEELGQRRRRRPARAPGDEDSDEDEDQSSGSKRMRQQNEQDEDDAGNDNEDGEYDDQRQNGEQEEDERGEEEDMPPSPPVTRSKSSRRKNFDEEEEEEGFEDNEEEDDGMDDDEDEDGGSKKRSSQQKRKK